MSPAQVRVGALAVRLDEPVQLRARVADEVGLALAAQRVGRVELDVEDVAGVSRRRDEAAVVDIDLAAAQAVVQLVPRCDEGSTRIPTSVS